MFRHPLWRKKKGKTCFDIRCGEKRKEKHCLSFVKEPYWTLCTTGREEWSFLLLFVLKYISTYSCLLSVVPRQRTGLHVKNIVSRQEKLLPVERCFLDVRSMFSLTSKLTSTVFLRRNTEILLCSLSCIFSLGTADHLPRCQLTDNATNALGGGSITQ